MSNNASGHGPHSASGSITPEQQGSPVRVLVTVESLQAEFPDWKIWRSSGRGLWWATAPERAPIESRLPAAYSRTVGDVMTGEALRTLIIEQNELADR